MKKIKLNLGCGLDIKPGWINIDKWRSKDPEVLYWDLDDPLPAKSHWADYILIRHTLEHIKNPIQLLKECYRILKIDGQLEIVVPYYKHKTYLNCIDHRCMFTPDSLKPYTEKASYGFQFTIKTFEKLSREFPYCHMKKYLRLKCTNVRFRISTLRWVLEK